ncbi:MULTISPECIES: hypothetical protein [Candidatus Ichthyocystis]|uniref:hypothetical protein n=1 Tax=Candidatus Ichthyocystis TaxID=2929841 RepID=UPI0015849ED6|nr:MULTISPECIES: hypothetical protein [Ichthyocystis]
MLIEYRGIVAIRDNNTHEKTVANRGSADILFLAAISMRYIDSKHRTPVMP